MRMSELDVYVYGMTVLSTIHLLKGDYPKVDTYQEIEQTFVIPGGEAANAAVVLRNLGLRVALDGCFLGDLTKTGILEYFEARDIDCSRMTHLPGFPGWRDLVLCDGKSRTVFGWFVQYLFGEERLWTTPSEDLIQRAKCVALDPFFGAESEQVAALCVRYQVDYVTIDCHWDSQIAQSARTLVCSKEFIEREYPDWDDDDLLTKYRSVCKGLVIFTFGGDEVLYASPAYECRRFKPYPVEIVDTLGAGDTFRAGVVYAVLKGMPDDDIVRFASACAAVACTRFPSVYEPPTLEKIEALMASRA